MRASFSGKNATDKPGPSTSLGPGIIIWSGLAPRLLDLRRGVFEREPSYIGMLDIIVVDLEKLDVCEPAEGNDFGQQLFRSKRHPAPP